MTHQYMGAIEKINIDSRGSMVARVCPLAEWTQGSFAPMETIDRVKAFPDSGMVMWFRVGDAHAQEGALYLFDTEVITTDTTAYPEKYRVAAQPVPIALFRIVDLNGSWHQARLELSSKTFRDGHPILVRSGSGEMVGPLYLSETTSGYMVNWSQPHIEQCQLRKGANRSEGITWKGEPYVSVSALTSTGETVDLRDSHDVTVTALKQLIEDSSHLTKETGVTKRKVNAFLDALVAKNYSNIDVFRMEVAKQYLTNGSVGSVVADELAEIVISDSQIQESIEVRKLELLNQAEAEGREARSLAQQQAEMLHLNAKAVAAQLVAEAEDQRALLHQESKRVESQIEEKRLLLEKFNAKMLEHIETESVMIEAALRARLVSFNDQIHESVADVMWVRALAGTSTEADSSRMAALGPKYASDRVVETQKFHFPPIETSSLIHVQQLREVIEPLGKVIGKREIGALIQALLSQSVPIVFGADAFHAINATANVMAAGRMHWVSIEPGLLSPSDLLIERLGSGQIQPAANRILDLVMAAIDDAKNLYVLVLDGINRSAVDSYLLPILRLYTGTQKSLPLFRADQLPHESDFRALSSLGWPGNLLLMATTSDPDIDFTALPLPRSVWPYSVPISIRLLSAAILDHHRIGAVESDTWRTWQSSKNEEGLERLGLEIREVHHEYGALFSAAVISRMRQFVRYSTENGVTAALDTMVRWIPFVLADDLFESTIEILRDSKGWDEKRHRSLLSQVRVEK